MAEGRLGSLQAGRGVSAVLLVLYHAGCCVFVPKYWSHDPVGGLFSFGFASFYFFFVLTGFTIASRHASDLGRPARLRGYLWRRFVRIYPLYWLVLVPVLAAYSAFPGLGVGFERDARTIISSLSLVAWGPMRDAQRPVTILLGAWALYHGVLFYALIGLALWSRKLGLAVLSVWLFASVPMLFASGEATFGSFVFAPLHLLFGLGMAAAWLQRRKLVPHARAPVLLGAALVSAAIADQLRLGALSPVHRALLYGVGFAGVILGLAELESRGRLRAPAALAFLGDASYSVFLVHFPVLILLAKLAAHWPGREVIPLGVWYAALTIVAVGAGVGFHVLVERPLLRRLEGAAT